MPVNILNLPGLDVLDFNETDDEYHIKESPLEMSRCCPHCNKSDDIVSHAWRTMVTHQD
jgi:transposase